MTSPPCASNDFRPFAIGRSFVVVPPGGEIDPGGRIPLVVARGAFGSGEHETTSSCLELIETLPDVRGARILDLGAGTGILAMAALLLGASRALLIDNDARAAESCRLHAELNRVTDRVEVIHGELQDPTNELFDIALANIQADILVHVAPQLVRSVRPGGLFVLSGVVWELNWTVRDTWVQLGCDVLRNRFLDEYSTILARRR